MDTTDKIIAAFLRLLKQKPYAKISVNQLTKEVGITRTYFYQLFDNKEALAQAALYSIVRQILGKFTSSFANATATRLDHQSIADGIRLIRDRQGELKLLLAIHHGKFSLTAEFQHQLAQMVMRGLTSRFPQNDRLDYGVHVFIVATMETISWMLDHPGVPTAQIVQMVDDFSGRGMLTMLAQ